MLKYGMTIKSVTRILKRQNIVFISFFLLCVTIISCEDKLHSHVTDTDIYYTCSMDPQVIEYKPGRCPICKMELTQVSKSDTEQKDEIELSDQQIQLGNIQTDTLRHRAFGDKVVLTGTLNFDQMKTFSVSSRVMGRIEKLYYKNIGDYVRKGTPLYDIYSEDLNNARQEYLSLLARKKDFGAETVIDFDRLIQSGKNKLLLWGMTDDQIQELAENIKVMPLTTYYSPSSGYIIDLQIREGDYVMEGTTIMKMADLSTLWAEAQVYSSQLAAIDRHSKATVSFPDYNGQEVKGKLEFVNPEINPDTRINLIRVTIPNTGNRLQPGMLAYIHLTSSTRNTLTLPIDAVIRNSQGATAWIKTGPHSFMSVMVTTGLELDDRIEIISGLQEGDIVVMSGAYLLTSEYVFKKGTNQMAGHQH
jgi:Cu(I)/Ag(I) efflux system membrane fusion protein